MSRLNPFKVENEMWWLTGINKFGQISNIFKCNAYIILLIPIRENESTNVENWEPWISNCSDTWPPDFHVNTSGRAQCDIMPPDEHINGGAAHAIIDWSLSFNNSFLLSLCNISSFHINKCQTIKNLCLYSSKEGSQEWIPFDHSYF